MGFCVICAQWADCKRCVCGGGFYCSTYCQRIHWAVYLEPRRVQCGSETARAIVALKVPPEFLTLTLQYVYRPPARR